MSPLADVRRSAEAYLIARQHLKGCVLSAIRGTKNVRALAKQTNKKTFIRKLLFETQILYFVVFIKPFLYGISGECSAASKSASCYMALLLNYSQKLPTKLACYRRFVETNSMVIANPLNHLLSTALWICLAHKNPLQRIQSSGIFLWESRAESNADCV